jgi:hypothetical protein
MPDHMNQNDEGPEDHLPVPFLLIPGEESRRFSLSVLAGTEISEGGYSSS